MSSLHFHADEDFATWCEVARHAQILRAVEAAVCSDRKVIDSFREGNEVEIFLCNKDAAVPIGVIRDHPQIIIVTNNRVKHKIFAEFADGKSYLEVIVMGQCLKRAPVPACIADIFVQFYGEPKIELDSGFH